jgi:hypothetical protein
MLREINAPLPDAVLIKGCQRWPVSSLISEDPELSFLPEEQGKQVSFVLGSRELQTTF